MSPENHELPPSGTFTFLFTDIRGSTQLLNKLGERKYSRLLEDHQRLLRDGFRRYRGVEIGTEGDSFFVAFPRSADGVAAALSGQIEIAKAGLDLSIRMGLHTGDVTRTPAGYVGLAIHQAQRISAAAHGGQVLISGATRHLLRAQDLPDGTGFIDLGEHRFKDLAEPVRIYQLGHSDLPSEFPPIISLETRAHNLPIQLTTLVGRGQEIQEVTGLLGSNRLVTLTGAAGCGKTRLALHVAAELLDREGDGVWLAELADLSDPRVVPRRVAEALGVSFESADFGEAAQTTSEVSKRLEQYMKSRKLLLVLDNCEHLLSSCAELTQALLRACPDVKILATSREPLGLVGESAYRVPSLSVPDPEHLPPAQELAAYESVSLFIERATLVDPGFRLTDENADAVAQISHRLDGMPLGIELAAAKVRVLTPHQIAARLDQMFRLLTGGGRTALERQQTLRAAVDWSFRLLAEAERVLLQRLSVFVGGFDMEAAEEVCSGEGIDQEDVLDLLTHLVDASFVIRQEQRGTSRYRLLEAIRQYAREKLFESGTGSQMRTHHRDYYLKLAEQAEDQQYRGPIAHGLDIEREESDNLLAALDWSLSEEDADEAVRMCFALDLPWFSRGLWSAMYPRCEAALSISAGQETPARADLLGQVATMAAYLGKPEGQSMGEEAVALARRIGDRGSLARGLTQLVGIGAILGDSQLAASALDEALPILEYTEQHFWTAKALDNFGRLAFWQGDFEGARSKLEESLSLARRHQMQFWILVSSAFLGTVQLRLRKYDAARSSYSEALAIAEEAGLQGAVIRNRFALGSVAQAQGDHDTANSLFESALVMARESGEPRQVVYALEGLASAALARGSYDEARSFREEYLVIARELHAAGPALAYSLINLGWLSVLEGDLSAARPLLEEALASVRNTDNKLYLSAALHTVGELNRHQGKLEHAQRLLEESLAIAREIPSKSLIASALSGLGELARTEQDHSGAVALHREALQLRRELGEKSDVAESIQALGGVSAAASRLPEACRLFGAAEALWNAAGSVMPPVVRPGYESDVELIRSGLATETFDAEWAKGRAMSAEEAVDYALTEAVVTP